jgi:hypothetical protein
VNSEDEHHKGEEVPHATSRGDRGTSASMIILSENCFTSSPSVLQGMVFLEVGNKIVEGEMQERLIK